MEFLFPSLCFLLLLFHSVSPQNIADLLPRGWNSYNGFSWIISEEEFLENAAVLSKRLLPAGYEYAVVDAFWFRSVENGSDTIDKWGRPWPDPKRWPSSVDGIGFKAVADQVHKLGLKFGINILGGISQRAVDQKTPIFDSSTGAVYNMNFQEWHADLIQRGPCKYEPTFLMVNTSIEAGNDFLKSLIDLYVSWGVDFVKLDCVFGEYLDLDTITTVTEVLKENEERSVVLSVSPGVNVTEVVSRQVSGLVNMFSVAGNKWDEWDDVVQRFDKARDFASLIGGGGLRGNSWPDLETLPFGQLTDPGGVNYGPHRNSKLSFMEKRTQVTLFAITKSPMMIGGDLRNFDQNVVDIIFGYKIREIHSYSSNNMEFVHGDDQTIRVWVATGRDANQFYVAVFNLRDHRATFTVVDIPVFGSLFPGRQFSSCQDGQDLWHTDFVLKDNKITTELEPHDCSLFILTCT